MRGWERRNLNNNTKKKKVLVLKGKCNFEFEKNNVDINEKNKI